MRADHRRLDATPANAARHCGAASARQAALGRHPAPENRLTPADAHALHDAAAACGRWLVWALTDTDLEYPGRVTARAHEADHQGGALLPGALVANTLHELRAMLPAELTRRDRTSAQPPSVIESRG